MIDIVAVCGALEARLLTMTPSLATVFENTDYDPGEGTAYQQVFHLPGDPINYPGAREKLVGILQISLYYPQNAGAGAARERAKLVRAHFPPGLALPIGSVALRVTRTATIRAGRREGTRYRADVDVPWWIIG